MNRYRWALVAAVVSLVSAAAGLVLLFGGMAASDAWVGSLALVLLCGLAPAALAGGVSLAWLPARARTVTLGLSSFGFAAVAVVALAWSAGFDESDAGLSRGPQSLALAPAAITALVLTALAVFCAVSATLRTGAPAVHRMLRFGIAAIAGMAGAPALVLTALFGYVVMLPATIALCAVLIVVQSRATRTAVPASAPASAPAPMTVSLAQARTARRWAWVALSVTAATLIGGLVAGILLIGSDGATLAMGLMSATGHLAAIPLIVALTILSIPGSRQPHLRRAWAAVLVAGTGIAGGSAWQTVGVIAGDLTTLAGFAVIAASVALWLSIVTAARLAVPAPAPARAALAILIGLGGGVLYTLLAVGTAGGVLALVSGFLAFGGVRTLTRPRPRAAF